MKILSVATNNRAKAFEVQTERGTFAFPYAKLENRPTRDNRVLDVYPDPELGMEGFTYLLESGAEETVHGDAVLEYNRDPGYLNEVLLHSLTVQAVRALEESELSKRELIRRLHTSPSQFYRLLDHAYYGKSVGQMLALLHLLGMEVDLVVQRR